MKIHSSIQKLLNQQIELEKKASNHYLAMAIWSDLKGYKKSANLLYNQSKEELEHMLKLINYLIEHQVQPTVPRSEHIKPQYPSLKKVFENALQQEKETTKSIHHIIDKCVDLKDHRTRCFLDWYVEEQREEEDKMNRILELFDIITEEGIGLYTIDQEIGKIAAKEE